MTEQIMDMARSLGHVDGGQEEALEALCRAAQAELAGRLRPEVIGELSTEALEALIRPCGFCRGKARAIQALTALFGKYGFERQNAAGESTEELREELLAIRGVRADTADVILFFVDGKDGLTGPDYEVADLLRRTKKPVLLVVNKIDTPLRENDKAEFYALGMGEPHAISSVNLLGIGDLLEEMCKYLPDPDPDAEQEEGGPIKIAVVGRPNVGKSSLMNRLLGCERSIVTGDEGTTRDVVEDSVVIDGVKFVLSDTAGVNEEELADLSRDIVHVAGRLGDESFRPLQTAGLQGNSLSYRNSRIEELKEISGNRDMTQGGTAGGVTAASAIAALQEAGSKLSRDMLKSAYRAFAKECYLIIELMRQFYDEERIFRITGKSGESEFVHFSGQVLRAQPARVVGGVELGSHEPVFDIVVSAEKKSTFSRLSQNETAKECYQLGFFAPANADAALAALEMMDFEGIEKVRQRVRQNGTLAQQLAQMQAQMAQLTGLLEVQKKSKAPKLSGPAQELSTAAMARAMKTQKGEMR